MALQSYARCQDNTAVTDVVTNFGPYMAIGNAGNTSAVSVLDGPGVGLPRSFHMNTTDRNDFLNTTITYTSTQPITLCCWFKPTNSPGSTGTGYIMAVNGDQLGLCWDHTSAGFRGVVYRYNGSTYHTASFGTVSTGTWSHLAGIWDGTNLKSYVNGTQINTTTSGSNAGNGASIRIMGNGTTGVDNAKICDCRFYNSDENGNLATIIAEKDRKIVAQWELQDTSGTSITGAGWSNMSSTAGTTGATSGSTDASNWTVTGPGGNWPRALSFNSTNQRYVSLPDTTFVGNEITYLAWTRRTSTMIAFSGLIYSRNVTVSGFGTGNNATSKLGYTWNNASNTYNWDSGITIPLNEWCLCACAIEPTQATMYCISPSLGIASAVNSVSHGYVNASGGSRIGMDSFSSTRAWNGEIAGARVYNRTLTRQEVADIYVQCNIGYPQVIVS